MSLHRYDTAASSIAFVLALHQDFAAAQALLFDLARACPGCLKTPAPSVSFTGYSETSATLTLTFWAQRSELGTLRSQLQLAALKAFAVRSIALPQRCVTRHASDQLPPCVGAGVS